MHFGVLIPVSKNETTRCRLWCPLYRRAQKKIPRYRMNTAIFSPSKAIGTSRHTLFLLYELGWGTNTTSNTTTRKKNARAYLCYNWYPQYWQ